MAKYIESSILVTGCSSGIGRALVAEFADKGHRVLATARKPEDLQGLEGPRVRSMRLDVTDPQSIALAVDAIVEWTGRIDVVVNNAGYGLIAPMAEVELDDLRSQFETNVFGLVAVTQAVVPHMVARGSGRIVNIGSVSGVTTTPFGGPYSASKAALHMLSDALRMELRPFGIEVITVQPGSVESNFGERATEWVDRNRADSLYAAVADFIAARARASQDGAMDAGAFARLVVQEATAANPRPRLRAGKNSRLLPFLAWLPTGLRDSFLSSRFGLDTLAQK